MNTAQSGATFLCESLQSGTWGNPDNWINCNGDFPRTIDKNVLIKSGHSISIGHPFNFLNIHGLELESNSTLTGKTIIITVENGDFNSSQGKVSYESRFYVTANNGDIFLGAVDNINDIDGIILETSKDIIISESIGGVNTFRLQAFTSNPTGKMIIKSNITTDFSQTYNIPVVIDNSIILSSSRIDMTRGLTMVNNSLELNVSSLVSSTITDLNLGNSTSLTKTGLGVLVFDGQNSSEATIFIDEGTVFMNGPLGVNIILANNSVLRGDGIIHSTLMMDDSSSLIPGTNSISSQYAIVQIAELIMSSNANLTLFLGGTSPGINYNQLIAYDDVTLNGNLQVNLSYELGYSDEIIIIDNQSANPVTGQFVGLNEGAIVGTDVLISYQGGDGNDVSLTSSIFIFNNDFE